jgi:hypothetical protein
MLSRPGATTASFRSATSTDSSVMSSVSHFQVRAASLRGREPSAMF